VLVLRNCNPKAGLLPEWLRLHDARLARTGRRRERSLFSMLVDALNWMVRGGVLPVASFLRRSGRAGSFLTTYSAVLLWNMSVHASYAICSYRTNVSLPSPLVDLCDVLACLFSLTGRWRWLPFASPFAYPFVALSPFE
jgi:hypothetical protein